MNNEESCVVCFKIICRGCQWEPSADEVVQIQQGRLTACPRCGWSPAMTEG